MEAPAQPLVHALSIACRGASSSEKLVTGHYSFKLSSDMDNVSDTVFITAFLVWVAKLGVKTIEF